MTVTIATEVRPGKARNEDLAFFIDDLAGVLDGASLPYEPPCGHDSAWYVRILAKHLVAAHGEETEGGLVELLREGIRRCADEHAGCCRRPEEPLSGAATVVLVCRHGERLDYLVLCDSALLIDGDDGAHLITDERIAAAIRRQDPGVAHDRRRVRR